MTKPPRKQPILQFLLWSYSWNVTTSGVIAVRSVGSSYWTPCPFARAFPYLFSVANLNIFNCCQLTTKRNIAKPSCHHLENNPFCNSFSDVLQEMLPQVELLPVEERGPVFWTPRNVRRDIEQGWRYSKWSVSQSAVCFH